MLRAPAQNRTGASRKKTMVQFDTSNDTSSRGACTSQLGHHTEARTKLKLTVLLATTDRWFPTARLAMALANAGCNVRAICPRRHPFNNTSAVHQTYTYDGLMPLRSFA